MPGKSASETNRPTRAIVHVPRRPDRRVAAAVYVDVDRRPGGLRCDGRCAARYEQNLKGSISEIPAIIVNVTI